MHNLHVPEAEINEPLSAPQEIVDPKSPSEWSRNYHGTMMVAVKVVKLKFKWKGLQNIVEKYALNTVFPGTFLDSHRAMFSWSREWFPLTLQDIRRMEDELIAEQRQNAHFDEE
jgi:hypothetical protein